MRLADICARAGVNPQVAYRAFMAASEKELPDKTWAKEVTVANKQYVVGVQDDFPMYFVCFPCPYTGFVDSKAIVHPLENEDSLLEQLKNPVFQKFFVG